MKYSNLPKEAAYSVAFFEFFIEQSLSWFVKGKKDMIIIVCIFCLI